LFSKPWSFLSADLLGLLPNAQRVFVIVDYHSRYFDHAFLNSTTYEKANINDAMAKLKLM